MIVTGALLSDSQEPLADGELARAIGFAPLLLELDLGASPRFHVRITLLPQPQPLPELIVTGLRHQSVSKRSTRSS